MEDHVGVPGARIKVEIGALFVWLISHQPAVLFSQNKPATSNQPIVLFSQNKSAPAISHQPNEQAEDPGGDLLHVLYSHVGFASLNPISSDQVLSLRLCLRLGLFLPQSSL
jgi:hypothetical protein